MPNVADLLTRAAVERPDRVVIKVDDTELSYAELDHATSQTAAFLREKGVRPGDRVAVMLPNVAYFPICYYGALRAGAAVVPMNVLLKEREVAFHVGDSEATLLLAWHEFADAARAGAAQTDAECVLVTPGEFEAMIGQSDQDLEVVERTIFSGVGPGHRAWGRVLGLARRAHRERGHRRQRPVIRDATHDREARPAVRAVDERIAEAAVGRVEQLAQAVGAGRGVGRDRGVGRASGRTRADGELGLAARGPLLGDDALDHGERRRVGAQARQELLDRIRTPLDLEQHTV